MQIRPAHQLLASALTSAPVSRHRFLVEAHFSISVAEFFATRHEMEPRIQLAVPGHLHEPWLYSLLYRDHC